MASLLQSPKLLVLPDPVRLETSLLNVLQRQGLIKNYSDANSNQYLDEGDAITRQDSQTMTIKEDDYVTSGDLEKWLSLATSNQRRFELILDSQPQVDTAAMQVVQKTGQPNRHVVYSAVAYVAYSEKDKLDILEGFAVDSTISDEDGPQPNSDHYLLSALEKGFLSYVELDRKDYDQKVQDACQPLFWKKRKQTCRADVFSKWGKVISAQDELAGIDPAIGPPPTFSDGPATIHVPHPVNDLSTAIAAARSTFSAGQEFKTSDVSALVSKADQFTSLFQTWFHKREIFNAINTRP